MLEADYLRAAHAQERLRDFRYKIQLFVKLAAVERMEEPLLLRQTALGW